MAIDYLLTTEGDTILTTEGETPIHAFTVMENLEYGLKIDWDGDGEYDDHQEADRILRWESERGRERIYRPSGNGFNPYEIGRLMIELDNYDGRYDPWNTSSPLYGNIMPGRNVQLKIAVYDETDTVDEHNSYFTFTGTLSDLRVNGYKKSVTMIIEDGWRFLADFDIFRFPYTASASEVQGELDKVLRLEIFFNASAIAYEVHITRRYPWGFIFTPTPGIERIPRHWWWDGTAKSCIEMIVFASLGRAFVHKDGRFVFRDLRETTDTPVTTLDEDILLKDIYLPVPWENLRSEVVLKGSNNYIDINWNKIASLPVPILVEAGETVQFSLNYEYLDVKPVYCPRILSVSFAAHSTTDSSGTNLTEFIQREIEPRFTNVQLTATNVGLTDAYLTTFDIEGEALDVIEHSWRFEADDPYRESSFVLQNPWLTITRERAIDGYIQETATTQNDKERIDLIGASLLEHVSEVRPYPVVQMRGRWDEQFELELEDKVTFTSPTHGINDNFRVSKIAHRSMGSPQDVLTTLWLYPPIEPAST